MPSATSSHVDIELDARLDDPAYQEFLVVFARASDQRLHALYDEVSSRLSETFEELRVAASDQLAVLGQIAELVGLAELALDQPLAAPESEALAQRIAWRSTARWSVLSLLWTLAGTLPAGIASASDWAYAALDDDAHKPRAKSGLPAADEQLALQMAAIQLINSLTAQHGSALLLRDKPVVIAQHETGVMASLVRPVGLVEYRSGRSSEDADVLSRGDRVWLLNGLTVRSSHSSRDGFIELNEDARLHLDTDEIVSLPVVERLALLYERQNPEEAPRLGGRETAALVGVAEDRSLYADATAVGP